MRIFHLNQKQTIFLFRCVIFLLLAFFTLQSPKMENAFSYLPFLLIAVYLISNIGLLFLPAPVLSKASVQTALFLMDITAISAVIYCGQGWDGDLYLIYFLVVFMSGIQMQIGQSFLIGTIASLLYVAIGFKSADAAHFLHPYKLLRIPFFYLISFFTAFFVQQVRDREKVLEETYREKLAQGEHRALIGRLAGKIALEFNNPLSVILGFSQSLLKKISSEDALYHPLDSIRREAGRCQEMMENFLLLSEESYTVLDRLDINVLIHDTVRQIKKEGVFSNNSVSIDEDLDHLLPAISGHRRQIQLALYHLMRNAVEAMPGGGRLMIKTSGHNGDKQVRLDVMDTGFGMDEAVSQRVFDPLFTTKKAEKEVGLGLILVQGVAIRHQADISFETAKNKGTRFTLLFPARASEAGGNG